MITTLQPNKLPEFISVENKIGILSMALSLSHHIIWIQKILNFCVELFCQALHALLVLQDSLQGGMYWLKCQLHQPAAPD